ncbi:MAG: nodulation protein NfeD [Alphaproteobacteria bacterium]|uniref:Nodulation protein NfeD n=1 Tax=Candidatus Nitrobium versatile TaxID=2884831 RepID=A0A953J825_9BACT|nr:nodulation protein NfeD [Candidatus Nitrobium versatile]
MHRTGTRIPIGVSALLLLLLLLPVPLCSAETEQRGQGTQGTVLAITVEGIINPVAAEYIGSSLKKASGPGTEALLIRLDTPGGLDTSMRNIVRDIIGSPVPVIVYVAPSGARAASAGVFITMAAHIAAMAPGTNIGAAHPVAMGEKMDKVMSEKVTNDAVAYLKSIAEQRGRNSRWAEEAVRKSASITETEAVQNRVIDLIAPDVPSLLSSLDGKEVTTAAGKKMLRTSRAKVIEHEMSLRQKILDLISNPNIAYILLLLGFYGLFFELANPGAVLPGVIGSICLILGFYALQTLPVNYAGLLLIITGIILFILEVKITSYGMLTVGGLLSLILGSLMLFESPLPFFRLSLSIVLPAALITALFFAVTLRLAYRAAVRKPVTGEEGLIGLEGKAKSTITPEGGMAALHGEIWSAFSDETIQKDERVVVTEVRGLAVKVKRIPLS